MESSAKPRSSIPSRRVKIPKIWGTTETRMMPRAISSERSRSSLLPPAQNLRCVSREERGDDEARYAHLSGGEAHSVEGSAGALCTRSTCGLHSEVAGIFEVSQRWAYLPAISVTS